MRLGAYVFGYQTPEEWAQIHIQKGYGAAYWPFETIDYTADDATIQSYCDSAKAHGLVIAEVGAWRNLFDADPKKREDNMTYCIGQLQLADRVGAKCCVNISGSLHPTLWDGAHPDNCSDRMFGMVVESIQHIIDAVKPQNTFYTVEPMPWMFPYDIDSLHKLINAVNRSAFGVHVDMCNMVNSFEKVYATGDMTRAFFHEFGPLIKSVHAKDTCIGDTLTMCIHEAIPGEGIFDYDALLTECAKLNDDLPVLAEHLHSEAEYDQATDYISRKARQLGLDFICGY